MKARSLVLYVVTSVVLVYCSGAYSYETNKFQQYNLKNETENLLTDTYSPEARFLNLNEEELFNVAMDSGSDVQLQVAMMFGQGKMVKRNFSKCIKLLEKASAKGDADAAFLLGTIYLKGGSIFKKITTETEYGGIIIPREFPYDPTMAFSYFLISGNQGDKLSHDVCCLIKKQLVDSEQDNAKAKKLLAGLEKASKNGNGLAQRFLAELYSEGKMVKQDDCTAFELFKESAEHGDAWGQYNTARKYISGLGVTRDTEKGFEWMKKAAEHNLAAAQFDLSVLYYLGTGTAMDKQMGYVWLLIAKANGNKEAESLVKEANDGSMTPEEQKTAHELAAKLLKQISTPKKTGRLLAALNR